MNGRFIYFVEVTMTYCYEAKYHKNCFDSYVSKSNLKHQSFREKDGESLYDEAFQELADSIEDGIAKGRAYYMFSLLSMMYKGLLANKGINASSYTKQHLKKDCSIVSPHVSCFISNLTKVNQN